MRLADLVTAGFLMLLGGVVLYDAARLGTGWRGEGPRSGFLPFWLAALLVAVSVLIFGQALVRRANRPFVTRRQLVPVAKVLGPLAAFILLTDPPGPWSGLGLYVAAAFYMGIYMRWVGRHHWVPVVGLSVAVPVVAFVVFEQWFLV